MRMEKMHHFSNLPPEASVCRERVGGASCAEGPLATLKECRGMAWRMFPVVEA